MIFVYITLLIAVLDILLWWLNAKKTEHIWYTRYPDLKIPESHWTDRAISMFKGIFMAVCPVFNIALLITWIVNGDEVCERSITSLYNKAIKEEQ